MELTTVHGDVWHSLEVALVQRVVQADIVQALVDVVLDPGGVLRETNECGVCNLGSNRPSRAAARPSLRGSREVRRWYVP